MKQLLRAAGPKAVRALIDMVESPTTKADVRVKAIQVLLDRAYGRVPMSAEDDGTGDPTANALEKLADAISARRTSPEPE